MDARAHDALSHLAHMTLRKKREWARVFLSARRLGLGRRRLLLFSITCAREMGAVGLVLLALRVVLRTTPTRRHGRRQRPAWHLPRAVWALAGGLAVWVLLALGDSGAPRAKWALEVEDAEVPEWMLSGPGDAGVVAKRMPSKRMKGQQAPPCGTAPVQVLLNDACWTEMVSPPPCGDFYEYEGRCYVPVVEKKRPLTSVQE